MPRSSTSPQRREVNPLSSNNPRAPRSPSPYRRSPSHHDDYRSQRHRDHARKSKDHEELQRWESRPRSRSPTSLRRALEDDEYDQIDRPAKRRRRHSSSPPQRKPRRDSPQDNGDSRNYRTRSRSPYERHRYEEERLRRNSSRHRSSQQSPEQHRDRRDRRTSRSHSRKRQRDVSPGSYERSKQRRHSSRSPHGYKHRSRKHHSKAPSPLPPPPVRSKAPLPSQQAAFSAETTIVKPDVLDKQKPNYASTGLLAAETNTVTTGSTAIVLKYHEPPEARLPSASAGWRLYIFKGKDVLETLELHRRSCWLFGRERAVVDVPVEHPSASKQHAVVQFRHVEQKNEWGEKKAGVKPYVIDLDSANGTKVNGEKVEGRRYVELRTGDVVGFGESSREYVLLLPPKG